MKNPYECLYDQIKENVRNYPDKIAYSINNQHTTFAELDSYSASIATALVGKISEDAGERENPVRIGICLPRNSHFISCIYAAVRLGCSYVPIDVATPEERIKMIIADSALDFVINEQNLPELMSTEPQNLLPCFHKDYSEAYMIYTSGTTGTPKGVSQTYRTIYNYMKRAVEPEDFHITPDSVILQFASINFDVSVMEIFVGLYAGCTSIIAQEPERHDANLLYKLLIREGITFCFLPPSLLSVFPDFNIPSLRTLSAGGEAIPHSLTSKIVGKYPFRFVNGYGPSESFYATTHVIRDADDWRCVGKPVPGVIGVVVDPDLKPVAVGETGELLLGGEQLANGYWNRPDLNATSFFPNPFEETRQQAPILYHSGDKVRLNADGSFDYLGRFDSQVKLHGYRIELNEITTRVESHPRVRRAYTRIEELGSDRHLVIYVCTEDNNPELTDVREYLSKYVPGYMMPTFWNHVEEFKLNINGKIDKAQLVNSAWQQIVNCTQDLSENEQILMHEVARLIGVPSVSVEADLINDVGMTSLQIMQIPQDLESCGFKVTVDDIYRHRTIRKVVNNHLYRISFWYEDPALHPERDVIIYISGHPHFGYCEEMCKQFADKFNIFVIESFHTIMNFGVITTPELVELYKLMVAPVFAEHHVVAYVGYCMGGEQALAMAHDLHNDSCHKPLVAVLDGEVCRDKDPEHYIPLRWPTFTPRQNELRRILDTTLISTTPDEKIYNGPVVSFISRFFDEQQTMTPEEQKEVPEYVMTLYRERHKIVPDLWRQQYPQADVIMADGSHYTFMHEPSCLKLVYDYIIGKIGMSES